MSDISCDVVNRDGDCCFNTNNNMHSPRNYGHGCASGRASGRASCNGENEMIVQAPRSNGKFSGKRFCSLAYLAKSSIAINDQLRNAKNAAIIINNHSSASVIGMNGPNVGATAKANDRDSPSLPIGSSTITNNHNNNSQVPPHSLLNGDNNNRDDNKNTQFHMIGDCLDNGGDGGGDDVCDTDDLNREIMQRPWKLENNNCIGNRRIPSVFLPQHPDAIVNPSSSSLPPSKYSSLDCWDYTIELECLKGPQDLQLAAELGKTLLERNKELEALIKDHKHTIEEQEQEILYLKKHTTALREVNDSRLKVYEQLEVGIQELERAKHHLLVENTNDKRHIKTLTGNIESLEARCEELAKQLEEERQNLSIERRKNERLLAEKSKTNNNNNRSEQTKATNNVLRPMGKDNCDGSSNEQGFWQTQSNEANNTTISSDNSKEKNINSASFGSVENSLQNSIDLSMVCNVSDGSDEIIKLVQDLDATKRAYLAEQQRCSELEEQLVATIQENQTLQSRIAQANANEDMKSMHDELSILDEVRQGQMCSRCLRSIDITNITGNDERSSLAPTEECEEDEEHSLLELDVNRDDNASEHSQAPFYNNTPNKVVSHISGILDLNIPDSPNPYRDLVEKYEALLEVQRTSLMRKANNGMSLAEEFQSNRDDNAATLSSTKITGTSKMALDGPSDTISTGPDSLTHNTNNTVSNNGGNNNKMDKSNRGRTPTELSEAETFSSGYSEETCNKSTQTDDRPGYFLCSIGDGEDCKFSIYDDVSPIDSRFRNRPEYRELFKEIFAVLKKAAENKEEGEKLPLLDDTHPTNNANLNDSSVNHTVPPVTPATEELPTDFIEDSQSIISSAVSEQSFAMSECITKLERKTAKKHINEKNQENKPPVDSVLSVQTNKQQTSIENGRILTPLKREPLDFLSAAPSVASMKKKNRRKNRNYSNDRSESPMALPTPPKYFVGSGRKRREMRNFMETSSELSCTTSGSSMMTRPDKHGAKYEWNGNSMVIYNRSMRNRSRDNFTTDGLPNEIEYHPSSVSQDLHKLKKLDLSYAEVLRRADACNQHNTQQQHQQHSKRRNHHRH